MLITTGRGTDWTEVLFVSLYFGTGMLSRVSGHADDAQVFAGAGVLPYSVARTVFKDIG